VKLKKHTKLLGEKAIKENKMARQFLAPQREHVKQEMPPKEAK
jgi:hypothetical protein